MHGYAVSEAATLADAMRALEKSPASVLLDLMLPDGCGTDLLRTLGARGRADSACVITGCGPALLQEARDLGAGRVLTKPLDIHALLTWLAAAAPAPHARGS